MELRNTVELKQFECEFCNKIFGNKHNLLQHQKKTKYCLRLHRNEDFNLIKEYKNQEEYKEKQKIKCPFCYSIFANIILLDQHQKRAKHCLKIQEELAKAKEKDDKIKLSQASELTCPFCEKQFKTKYILLKHQTEAKYCLKIQESQNLKEIISSLVTCRLCDKNFSTKNFKRHDLICKKKNQSLTEEIVMLKMKDEKDKEIAKIKFEKDEEISRIKFAKDQEITKLKSQNEILKIEKEKDQEISSIYKASAAAFEQIAKQPIYQKNSTKNIQNNLMISSLTPLDLSQARVDSIIDEKYTKNDFYEGQKGAAHLIHKHLLTDSKGKPQIVCTDTERGTFHHIDINGEHVVDYKNVHLINQVHSPLKRKAGKFAAEECVKNPEAFKEIIMNESSIRELETKPSLFNRTMAQLTGKNCARPLITTSVDQPPPILSITEEWLLENTKFLTIEHILRGPEGYADYFMCYPLKDRILVVDYSNAFVKFKDGCDELIDDTGAVILTKLIFDSIQVINKEIIMEYCKCLNFADNGAEIVQLLDYKMAVEKCADGNYVRDENVDFRTEFIRCLLKYK